MLCYKWKNCGTWPSNSTTHLIYHIKISSKVNEQSYKSYLCDLQYNIVASYMPETSVLWQVFLHYKLSVFKPDIEKTFYCRIKHHVDRYIITVYVEGLGIIIQMSIWHGNFV
jgi:hypothetical protein